MEKYKKERLKLFIDRMNEENDSIKNIKKDDIKLLLFNNNKTIQGIIEGIIGGIIEGITNDVVEI